MSPVEKNRNERMLLERLNQQLRFTQEIINAIPTPVFYIDRVGHYVGCNRAFEQFFGVTQHELISRSMCGVNPMQPRELHEQMDRECLSSNQLCRYDAQLVDFHGRAFDVIITKAPYLADKGKSGGIVGTFTDITDRKQSEVLLQQMQGQIIQQEKMASIGQLAAGVAHEINNPLGFITSNLTSLGKYAGRLDEYIAALQQSLGECTVHPDRDEIDTLRQKLKVDYIISDMCELVNESLDGANRVRRIVQDLKSFSRLDEAECCRTNLNESLDTTINIAWNELKYITTLDRNFGEVPDIVCYPQQLNQVFLNLLVNAAQAMEKQGNITVSTWHDAGNVFVSVADTGKGMPDEVKRRVFEPFFTTKEAGKGTGLGLSISADIVRKHGGEISVASEPGIGTTFTVRLPVNSQLE
ncbi:MAG: ATP-binding protein [Desulfuromonadaceae bacterium]|nr:ATP-binding protein [Desulfuromonadaceae bacterium]MDD5105540.1 ATP-binding protein [Desulfuromonadaceae bacterium]